ncbi:MAG: hypothetical protein ACI92G_004084 [Candidatus Pelagisphaera sp.]|jgi:hypothetical protein
MPQPRSRCCEINKCSIIRSHFHQPDQLFIAKGSPQSSSLTTSIDFGYNSNKIFLNSTNSNTPIHEGIDDLEVENYIHEKGYKNRPLSEVQKEMNKAKSSIRCRVEHIFGYIENSMGGPELRYIGLARNAAGIGLCNLAYNLKRCITLIRNKKPATA